MPQPRKNRKSYIKRKQNKSICPTCKNNRYTCQADAWDIKTFSYSRGRFIVRNCVRFIPKKKWSKK